MTANVVAPTIMMAVGTGGRADGEGGDQRKGEQTHGASSYACGIAALGQRQAYRPVPARPDHNGDSLAGGNEAMEAGGPNGGTVHASHIHPARYSSVRP